MKLNNSVGYITMPNGTTLLYLSYKGNHIVIPAEYIPTLIRDLTNMQNLIKGTHDAPTKKEP